MPRLETLLKLAESQPADPLARYAVGLEYVQLDRWDDALTAFAQTITIDPGYVAAYAQKARAELKLHQSDAARQTLQAGIAVAEAAHDRHAAYSMQKTLETLS